MSARKQTQAESFANALAGIRAVVAGEAHMKVHVAVAALALAACAVLRVEAAGWCAVLVCIGAVLAAELFNTALESLCDEVTLSHSPRIKLAKDAAAGAVLVLACASVVVGLIVYVPALLRMLG